jgi:transglutaminase-like putative cysteine protease
LAAIELKRTTIWGAQIFEKLAALLLLFVLLTAAVAGVTSVLTGPDWGSLWRGLIIGLLLGWFLAIFNNPAWRSALIAVPLGAIYALVYSSGLRHKFSDLLTEIYFMVSRIIASPYNVEVNYVSINQLFAETFNTTTVVFDRVHTWILDLVMGEPSFDPVAAAFVWILLVWIVSAWAGWVALAYRSALIAVLPALLLSIGTLSYGRRESFSLYLMLGSTLLLLATVQHDRREHRWDETNTAYPQRKGRQVGGIAVMLSAAIVLLSASVTYISMPRILEWVSAYREPVEQQEGDLAKSLGIMIVSTATPDAFENVRRPGLPRDHLIGSSPDLSKRLVMTVVVKNLNSLFKGGQPQPLYWRSFTYDVYTGRGWQTSGTTSNQYQPEQPLQSEQVPQHILMDQVVRPVRSVTGVVYAAGEPLAVSQANEAAWRSPEDLFGILINTTGSYTVRSLIPVANEGTLRAERPNYPDWIKQRYLTLPSEVPGRVKELALQLTASAPTPYDRVKAIENYLRTIPYTLDVPYPPVDQDLVDFFLFDLRRGYCDYYASAMVVLARAAGVPARFVIGYASGTYDLNARRFLVSEADAHSWVEVYFPDTGWVSFEPTAGRPPLEKSIASTSVVGSSLPSAKESAKIDQMDHLPAGWFILLGLIILISVFGVAWVGFQEIQLRRLTEIEAAVEIYRRMKRFGIYLAVTSEQGDTPNEYAASLRSGLPRLSQFKITPLSETRVLDEISTIIEGIVETCYRPSQYQNQNNNLIIDHWKRLRWRLSLIWLMKYYQLFRDHVWGKLVAAPSNRSAGVEQEG